MKNIKQKIFAVALVLTALQSCKLEPVLDPNFASVGAVSKNATKAQLDALAIGSFSLARNGLATYTQVTGVIGKEVFNFNTTESRWWTELNGLRPIDNSAFYNTATTAFGLPVRQGNLIISACDNTNLVTDVVKNSYKGVANTFKGLAYLYMLNAQGKNGIRLNVEDPFNPSKPVSYAESLAGIAKLLDEGATQLDGAGTSFPFISPTGFKGGNGGFSGAVDFTTPANFKKFNRAIAARVALYQGDYAKVNTLLGQSFLALEGDLNTGPKHTFSPSSPDFANPLLNTSSVRVVAINKNWDALEKTDKRLSKLAVQTPSISYSAAGTSYDSKYLTSMYKLANDAVPIIRNEELMLMAAEVAAATGKEADALKIINSIRKANGSSELKNVVGKDNLINAVLEERYFSLFYEGHRWIDMRRLGKLAQIELPVVGMKVLEQLERPVAEVNWDNRIVK
jgi:starch-binding outer membrane protein, SusD/RagB family